MKCICFACLFSPGQGGVHYGVPPLPAHSATAAAGNGQQLWRGETQESKAQIDFSPSMDMYHLLTFSAPFFQRVLGFIVLQSHASLSLAFSRHTSQSNNACHQKVNSHLVAQSRYIDFHPSNRRAQNQSERGGWRKYNIFLRQKNIPFDAKRKWPSWRMSQTKIIGKIINRKEKKLMSLWWSGRSLKNAMWSDKKNKDSLNARWWQYVIRITSFFLLEIFERNDVLVSEGRHIEPPVLWVALKVARVAWVWHAWDYGGLGGGEGGREGRESEMWS